MSDVRSAQAPPAPDLPERSSLLPTLQCVQCGHSAMHRLQVRVTNLKAAAAGFDHHQADSFLTNTFNCPHCHTLLKLHLRIEVLEVLMVGDPSAPAQIARDDRTSPLASEQLALVESFKSTGLLDAFEQAVITAHPQHRPRRLDRFLITWLATAQPRRLRREALQQLMKEYPGERIEIWSAQGIIAIIVGGRIRQFVPLKVIFSEPTRRLATDHSKVHPEQTTNSLTRWIKTRHGYVSGKGEFFEDLRRALSTNV